MNKFLVLSGLALFFFLGCKTDSAEQLYPSPIACDTSNIKYSANVQPILQANCMSQGCHINGNANGGFQFDTYDNFKMTITSGKLLNAIRYTAGGSKNMPPVGKMNDCDIKKIEAWVARGYPNN